MNLAGYLIGVLGGRRGGALGAARALDAGMALAASHLQRVLGVGSLLLPVAWRMLAGLAAGNLMALAGPGFRARLRPRSGRRRWYRHLGVGGGVIAASRLVPALLPAGLSAACWFGNPRARPVDGLTHWRRYNAKRRWWRPCRRRDRPAMSAAPIATACTIYHTVGRRCRVMRSFPCKALGFRRTFGTSEISTNGTTIYVRFGGTGPAVVLLHGYGETGDMWAPDGRRSRTRPHRSGAGPAGTWPSSKPAAGFDKKTQAGDVAGVLDELKINRADVVTHDIGNMVGYAFAAQIHRVPRFVLIDAPLPGVGPWEEILKNPLLWHFRFGGPDMERLVAGRERIYLDRFWNEFCDSAGSARRPASTIRIFKRCQAAMHSGFMQFAAFDQSAIDNGRFFPRVSSPCRCWGLAARSHLARQMATIMRFAASNVREGVIPDFGHWIMEEIPRRRSPWCATSWAPGICETS